MRKKHLYTFLQILFFMGLGLGLIYWRYTEMSDTNKDVMATAFEQINWWVSIPIGIAGFLSHYFRALRWKILLKTVQLKPSNANTTFAVLIGYLANAVVPRLGEVAKCTVLAKYEKTAPDKAIGTIIAERTFDSISLLIVMLMVLLLENNIATTILQEYFGKYLYHDENIVWKTVALFLLIAIVGIAIFIFTIKKFQHTKVGKVLNSLGEGIASIWKMQSRMAFLMYSVLIWLMYTSLVYIAFHALDATSSLSFSVSLAIVAFGSIGMIVTPGGIGTYPLIVAGVLILFGINEGVGTAFGWICWGMQTILVLVLGIASLILLPIINDKNST